MALIQCPECGQNVSDTASTCIHCGYALSAVAKAEKTTDADMKSAIENWKKEEEAKQEAQKKEAELIDADMKAVLEKWKKEERVFSVFSIILLIFEILFIVILMIGSFVMRDGYDKMCKGIIPWYILFVLANAVMILLPTITKSKSKIKDMEQFGKKRYRAYIKKHYPQDLKNKKTDYEWWLVVSIAMGLEYPERKSKDLLLAILASCKNVAMYVLFLPPICLLLNAILYANAAFDATWKPLLFLLVGIVVLIILGSIEKRGAKEKEGRMLLWIEEWKNKEEVVQNLQEEPITK